MAPNSSNDEFPWHLGVFDAHCHPTDTLSSLQEIKSMRANVLTVMATRAQDQELVAKAADDFGLTKAEAEAAQEDVVGWSTQHKILPAFGWHPWFSHHMFDESQYDGATSLKPEQKVAHYQSVLTPRSEDQDFLQSLPDPRPLGHFLSQTRKYLQTYPLALIGEVGLDRAFRIPESWLPGHADHRDENLTPGGREGRKLSPYRVNMEHQKAVLRAQLALAGDMQRAVSCHGVQAHGVVYETLAGTWKGCERRVVSRRERNRVEDAARKVGVGARDGDGEDGEEVEGKERERENAETGPKPHPPRICLHSYSGPAETVKLYTAPSVPVEVFFSFSTTINAWTEDGHTGKVEAAVHAVPDERILVESDLHTAGERLDGYLEEGVRKICEVKGWGLEEGVRRLGRNWRRFALGRE